MKATEAKELMKKGNLDGYPEIVEKIRKAAENGESRVLHYKPELKNGVISRLKDDGFSVESGHDRDGYLAIIDWSK